MHTKTFILAVSVLFAACTSPSTNPNAPSQQMSSDAVALRDAFAKVRSAVLADIQAHYGVQAAPNAAPFAALAASGPLGLVTFQLRQESPAVDNGVGADPRGSIVYSFVYTDCGGDLDNLPNIHVPHPNPACVAGDDEYRQYEGDIEYFYEVNGAVWQPHSVTPYVITPRARMSVSGLVTNAVLAALDPTYAGLPAAVVFGCVIDPVTSEVTDMCTPAATTDIDGNYTLRALLVGADYMITASYSDEFETNALVQTVPDLADGMVDTIELLPLQDDVTNTIALTGCVTDADDQPVPGAFVFARDNSTLEDAGSSTAIANGSGCYSIVGVDGFQTVRVDAELGSHGGHFVVTLGPASGQTVENVNVQIDNHRPVITLVDVFNDTDNIEVIDNNGVTHVLVTGPLAMETELQIGIITSDADGVVIYYSLHSDTIDSSELLPRTALQGEDHLEVVTVPLDSAQHIVVRACDGGIDIEFCTDVVIERGVSQIDPTTIGLSHDVSGYRPRNIAITPDRTRAYMTSLGHPSFENHLGPTDLKILNFDTTPDAETLDPALVVDLHAQGIDGYVGGIETSMDGKYAYAVISGFGLNSPEPIYRDRVIAVNMDLDDPNYGTVEQVSWEANNTAGWGPSGGTIPTSPGHGATSIVRVAGTNKVVVTNRFDTTSTPSSVWVVDFGTGADQVSTNVYTLPSITGCPLNRPVGVAADAINDYLYIADATLLGSSADPCIARLSLSNPATSTGRCCASVAWFQ